MSVENEIVRIKNAKEEIKVAINTILSNYSSIPDDAKIDEFSNYIYQILPSIFSQITNHSYLFKNNRFLDYGVYPMTVENVDGMFDGATLDKYILDFITINTPTLKGMFKNSNIISFEQDTFNNFLRNLDGNELDLEEFLYGAKFCIGNSDTLDDNFTFDLTQNGRIINLKNAFRESNISHINLNTEIINTNKMAGAFYNCNNLYDVTFKSFSSTSATSDLSSLFYNCNNLMTTNLFNFLEGSSVIKNADWMFAYCSNLQELQNINHNINFMYAQTADYMFSGCTQIESFTPPTTSLKTINDTWQSYEKSYKGMFEGCSSLVYTNMFEFWRNHKVRNIVDLSYLFSGCSSFRGNNGDGSLNLTGLDLRRANLDYMFYNCTSLERIDFRDTMMSDIGKYTFRGCTSLKEIIGVELPSSNIDAFAIGSKDLSILDLRTNNVNSGTIKICSQSSTYGGYVKHLTLDREKPLAPNYKDGFALNLTYCRKINLDEFFDSLAANTTGYGRSIILYTNVYNALTETQKALVADKGYTLTSRTT